MNYSKKQINKAGEILKNSIHDKSISTDEINDAMQILSHWRSRHVQPLLRAYQLVKRYADKVGNNAIYGQRLKRTRSIIYKLNRMEGGLSRLQDIGGCRVILSGQDRLLRLYELLKTSKSILPNHKNYLLEPKADGYRSIHLIYQSSSKEEQHDKLKIEIQLRTKLQHSWATAVEIIDTFNHEKLKIGQGSTSWQKFFYLVADEFAQLEKLPVHSAVENRKLEIRQLAVELNVIEKMTNYSLLSKNIEVSHDLRKKYLVLWLNPVEKRLKVFNFGNEQTAQELYLSLEQTQKDKLDEVVMVHAESIAQLKKSYPNYFADSKLFIDNLNHILKD